MPTLTLTVLGLLGLSSVSQALALSPRSASINELAALAEGQAQSDFLVSMDITNGIPEGPPELFNASTGAADVGLQARRQVDYCVAGHSPGEQCAAVGGRLNEVGTAVALTVKNQSNKKSCAQATRQSSGVKWSVRGAGSCETTALLATIAGAMDNYLRDRGSKVCGKHCIRLRHGGAYTGYVKLAPAGANLDGFYCGASYQFGNCGKGGEKDAHN